jgi:ABC-type methionine transport system ATPase subunit
MSRHAIAKESQRYWLTFTAELTRRPLIWEMSKKFKLVFNVRNANVTEQIGLIALELIGERPAIEAAVKWLRKKGVEVDPIELDVVEG